MKSEQAIINILREQINSYKKLLELLMNERISLVNIDADSIEHISKKKDTIVMGLRLLEEERQRLVTEFAIDNGVDSQISLHELGILSKSTQIPELRSQMISLLQSIGEMNRFNSVLVEKSLQQIRTSSGFFNSFFRESELTNTGGLLSKES